MLSVNSLFITSKVISWKHRVIRSSKQKVHSKTIQDRNMYVLLLFLISSASAAISIKPTFQNVKVEFITTAGLKNTTIEKAYSLYENIPKDITKAVQIEDQFIPILYRNSVRDLEVLFILKLSNNQIEQIEPGAFSNLPKLKSINLNLNNLSAIKSGVFNALDIERLQLDFNRIAHIDSNAFEHMAELNYLSISNNDLTHVDPHWFLNLNKLTYLCLSWNFIELIPDSTFAHLQTTHSTEEGIDIFLSNNRIKRISRKMFGNANKTLNWLSLNNNEITEWDEHFLDGIKLAHFEISSNNLTCLSGDLGRFFITAEIHVEENPWKCECITKIAEWIAGKYKLSEYQEDQYAKMVEERCEHHSSGTLVVHRSFTFI